MDWLTRLAIAPESILPLVMDAEHGILELLKSTYGKQLTENSQLYAQLRKVMAWEGPHMREAFQLQLLTALRIEESLALTFRESMTSLEDQAAFDDFLPFLKVQLTLLHTQPFEVHNAEAMMRDFLATILYYSWMTRNVGFMREHSTPMKEVQLKPNTVDEEEGVADVMAARDVPLKPTGRCKRINVAGIRAALQAHQELSVTGLRSLPGSVEADAQQQH